MTGQPPRIPAPFSGAWYPRHRLAGAPITIATYHAVSSEQDPYTVRPDTFRHHLEVIADRYSVARLRDLPTMLSGPPPARRVVILTFDDAYADFREHALPALQALGLPATVFVPTGHIGGWNAWDAMAGLPRRRIMSAEALREAHATGFVDLGSHTVDHVRMGTQSDDDAWRQAGESRQTLEALLGVEVTLFAYPYGQLGDYNPRTERALRRAGYRVAVTSHWGTRVRRAELLRLKRVFFADRDRDRVVEAKIEGAYDWRGWKEKAAFMARRLGLRRAGG